MLTKMDVLENHKAYDSINFELFFAGRVKAPEQPLEEHGFRPRGCFEKPMINKHQSTKVPKYRPGGPQYLPPQAPS